MEYGYAGEEKVMVFEIPQDYFRVYARTLKNCADQLHGVCSIYVRCGKLVSRLDEICISSTPKCYYSGCVYFSGFEFQLIFFSFLRFIRAFVKKKLQIVSTKAQ